MRNRHVYLKQTFKKKSMFLIASCLLSLTILAQVTLPKLGTSKVIGKVDGIKIEAKVQSPSGQQTPLQIVCLFEYTDGDIFNPPALPKDLNGMMHVDEAMHGLITTIRKDGKFLGIVMKRF
jgi:hypothetical protein